MLKSTKCEHRSLQSKVANGFRIYRCRKCGAISAKHIPAKTKSARAIEYMNYVGLDRNILYLTGTLN